MAGRAEQNVIGGITLVTGPEEFFAERAITGVVTAVRSADSEAEVSEALGSQLGADSLGELAAPSLFSSTRCVIVRRIEDLPEESVAGILSYAAAPADDVALVLVHSGGQKGTGVLTKLRKLSSVTEIKTAPLKGREFAGFVAAELRSHKVRIDEDAAEQLVRAIGQDTRGLAAAASQLVADFNGAQITLEMVKQYFGGRAEAKSFAIADAAVAGQTAHALEELRWALTTGTAPVLVTSAVAASLRGLIRLRSAPRGMREADLAREVGVPPWKLRDLRSQARAWDDQGLGRAVRLVARADADIKGQSGDAGYALERMVLGVTWSRSQAAG